MVTPGTYGLLSRQRRTIEFYTSKPRAPAMQTPDLGNMPTAHLPLTGAFPYVQLKEMAMVSTPAAINFANSVSPPFPFPVKVAANKPIPPGIIYKIFASET